MKIRAMIKRVGQRPYITNISDSLTNLQKIVGGYIETVKMEDGVVLLCDEEGRLKGYEHNCTVEGLELVGDIVIVGEDVDMFDDLKYTYSEMKQRYPALWQM